MIRLLFLALMMFQAPMAQADQWDIEPRESSLKFVGSQTGNAFEGRFERFTADIQFDPATPETAFVRAEIDTASAVTGDTQRDTALPGPEWFFVERFATAVFEAEGFTALGGDRYEAAGTLTIRDISQPLTLPFKLTINGDTASMSSEITLIRSAYGVGTGPWSEGKWVGLEVRLLIDITASRRAAP